jgi:hypothetical protein
LRYDLVASEVVSGCIIENELIFALGKVRSLVWEGGIEKWGTFIISTFLGGGGGR